jgi:hypothetical protein
MSMREDRERKDLEEGQGRSIPIQVVSSGDAPRKWATTTNPTTE